MAKTNVIFILADDMGYGDFGMFSEGRTVTPALDQMVSEGVCFTQSYAAAPVCVPSRAALLTGRYNHRTGAIDMRELRGLSNLATGETTIADVFKQNGYATGLMGKWHNGTIGAKYHPNARGFDEFVGFRGGMSHYYNYRLYYNDTMHEFTDRYLTDHLTDESVDFITRHKDGPFFLKIAYNAPHSPYEAPEEDIQMFHEMSKGEYTRAVSATYAMILAMDRGIARIFETLKKLDLDDNTIVLFTSDNGPQFGGQGENCSDRFNCNLRGAKADVFDGGIRVPAVLRWPGKLKAGAMEDCFVHGIDWFPTLLAAAGIKPPGHLNIDGQNILPVLTGETEKSDVRRFWQWNRYAPEVTCNAAMRHGKWKLVRPPIPEGMAIDRNDWNTDRIVERDPEAYTENINPPFPERTMPPPEPPLLFDIENDPCELNDLAAKHPDRAQQMLTELEAWFNEVEAERQAIQS